MGRSGPRFAVEAASKTLVSRLVRRRDADHLDGNGTPEPEIARAVDRTHPTATDDFVDAVAVDQGATGEQTLDSVHA